MSQRRYAPLRSPGSWRRAAARPAFSDSDDSDDSGGGALPLGSAQVGD